MRVKTVQFTVTMSIDTDSDQDTIDHIEQRLREAVDPIGEEINLISSDVAVTSEREQDLDVD